MLDYGRLGADESVSQLSTVPHHYNEGKKSKNTHVFISTSITYIHIDSQNPVSLQHSKLLFVRFYRLWFGST